MAQKNDQSIRRKIQIGEGSFGIVYFGSYLHYKEVAIKDIKGSLSSEALQEANLLKGFTHQNIIQCYDIIQTPNLVSIIMAFIDAGNLYGYIDRTIQSSTYWRTTKGILNDIAYGMTYLHLRNVVHADLKSINVLLRHDYSAVICDFGLARTIESQQTVRTSCPSGTVRWFAPELCSDCPERSSRPSDVWAYGCIILEVISKAVPWIDTYPNSTVLVNALAKEKNASIFENICTRQRAPQKLRALLCQCCTWRKRDRPEFEEIVRELNAISETDLDDINQGKAKSSTSDSPNKPTPSIGELVFAKLIARSKDEVDVQGTTCSLDGLRLPNAIPKKKKDKKCPETQSERASNNDEEKIFDKEHNRYLMRGPRGGLYYIGANGRKIYVSND